MLLATAGALVIAGPVATEWVLGRAEDGHDSSRRTARDSDAEILEQALRIEANRGFAAWLSTPLESMPNPMPRRIGLPNPKWQDHDRAAHRATDDRLAGSGAAALHEIVASIDAAYAEALDRQFGTPPYRTAPKTWHYDGDRSGAVVSEALNRKHASIMSAHGLREIDRTIGPDYDWIVARSIDACRPIAEAIVVAVTGRPPAEVPARDRVDALASYVQNAVPYRTDSEEVRRRIHGDSRERFGVMTPLMALLHGGDCDSKALLLATLIRSLDREVSLAVLKVPSMPNDGTMPVDHAVLGVGIAPKAGERTLKSPSGELVLVETTSDWGIGELPKDLDLSRLEIDEVH